MKIKYVTEILSLKIGVDKSEMNYSNVNLTFVEDVIQIGLFAKSW